MLNYCVFVVFTSTFSNTCLLLAIKYTNYIIMYSFHNLFNLTFINAVIIVNKTVYNYPFCNEDILIPLH